MRRVLLVVAIVVVVPPDSTAIPSSESGTFGNGCSMDDGVGRVRRVRRGRLVVVVLVDKFIISTDIFARIFSCISIDEMVDGVGRVLLVRCGRIVVVVLVKLSTFHTSYASVSGTTSLYSTPSYASPILSSSNATGS